MASEREASQRCIAAQADGRSALRAGSMAAAEFKFNETLQLLNQASCNHVIALLQNLSNAYMQLQQPAEALMHAAAVLALFPEDLHPKACFLAAKAAAALGNEEATKWLVSRVPVSSKTPALLDLAATVEAKIGTTAGRPFHEDHDLINAIIQASLQLVDPAPGSNIFRSLASTLDLQRTVSGSAGSTPWPPAASDAAAPKDPQARLEMQCQVAAELKLEGNERFRDGDFTGAVLRWSAALDALQMLPETVKNVVEAEIKQKHVPPERQAAVVSIALLWVPRTTGFHILRAVHAGQIATICGPPEIPPMVMKVLCTQQGLRLSPEDPKLASMHQELTVMLGDYFLAAALRSTGKTLAQQVSEQELQLEGCTDDLTGLKIKKMRQKMVASQATKTSTVVQMVGPVPESFDKQYDKSGLLPAGCNAQKCFEHLAIGAQDAFWQWTAVARPWLAAGRGLGSVAERRDAMDPLCGRDNPMVTPGSLSVRLAGEVTSRTYWWQHAALGSVAFRLQGSWVYHDGFEKVHSFCNVQQHALPLPSSLSGRHVHVAVGFVDLGEVAETLLAMEAEGKGEQQELQWHGYEASGHACALTLVVIQMLQADAPIDSIVQVWYSAAWSKATLSHFREAVAAVLNSAMPPSQHVRLWLVAWSTAEVPLKQSRREWLKRQVSSSANIANALCIRDRHELCSYRLTGQLLEACTGSVAMFEIPQRPVQPVDHTDEEDILSTISPQVLMAAYRGLAPADRTLLGAGLKVARHRVNVLKAALLAGRVSLQVHHATLSAPDTKLASSVRALAPDSMSWSNVPEYMLPQEFHHLARTCSLPHTCHVMHAMNWVTAVKGAFVLDYCEMPRSSAATVKQRCKIAAQAYADVKDMLVRLGATDVLRQPPLDNQMNVTDSVLIRQMYSRWLEAFASQVPCGAHVSVEVLHKPEYWFFSRTNSVVHFQLQYS